MDPTVGRLTPEEFHLRAEKPLRRVFKNLDWNSHEPFHDAIKEGLIVDISGFWLNLEEFQAVCDGAKCIGDDHLLYSIARRYLAGAELLPYYTWEIPLCEFEAYEVADKEPMVKGHDLGIPLDRALYSPTGNWSLLFVDPYALVGGPHAFVDRFKEGHRDWRAEVDQFLAHRNKMSRERNIDVSWVPRLLRRLYGDAAPEFTP